MKKKVTGARANLVVVSFVIAAFLLASNGCSNNNGGAEPIAPRNLNANYYQYLGSSTAIGHPGAQITVPASGELFSENTKHFDLVPAEPGLAGAALASLKESGFALYRPAGLSTKRSAAAKQAPGDEIPGFKNDNFPQECLSRTGDDQVICVDQARRKEHASYHDGESLRIQLGSDVPGKLADLVMSSVNAHLAAPDKSRIVARLTDFVNDDPAHATFDAAGHDIFNKAGYDFSHAVVTDDSRGDVDSDGDLDSHSTLIIEVRKSLQYERRSSAAIDACVAKHASSPFRDEYVVSINSFVHLDHLDGFRRDLVFDDPSPQTNARMLERVNAQHETR
ncbi:MAG TPA: hypothetical protein VFK48_08355, partial [Usitatibacter sp.]|nr:hypothetical protein [Usitatibacter sp.]